MKVMFDILDRPYLSVWGWRVWLVRRWALGRVVFYGVPVVSLGPLRLQREARGRR